MRGGGVSSRNRRQTSRWSLARRSFQEQSQATGRQSLVAMGQVFSGRKRQHHQRLLSEESSSLSTSAPRRRADTPTPQRAHSRFYVELPARYPGLSLEKRRGAQAASGNPTDFGDELRKLSERSEDAVPAHDKWRDSPPPPHDKK